MKIQSPHITGSLIVSGSVNVLNSITGSSITGSFFGTLNNTGIPFTYTFGGSGAPTAGPSTNTPPLKIFTNTTIISSSLSAQTAPSSATLTIKIEKSTSVTGSFTLVTKAILPSGSREITYGGGTFELSKGDVIRANVEANDIAADWIMQVYTEKRNI